MPSTSDSHSDSGVQPLSPAPDWTPVVLAGRDPRLPALYSIPNHPNLSSIEGVRHIYIFLEDRQTSGMVSSSNSSVLPVSLRPPDGWLILGEGDYVFSRDMWGDGCPAHDVLRVAVGPSKLRQPNIDAIIPHAVPYLPFTCGSTPQDLLAAQFSELVSPDDNDEELDADEMPGLVTPEDSDVDSGYASISEDF